MSAAVTMNMMTMESSPSFEDNDSEYDAFSASLYNRGAMMRKLRELEREDEAQRQREAEAERQQAAAAAETANDTLHYENYLANQAYYDDYKHVNYKYIDFGNTTMIDKATSLPSLVIEQDRTVGKGGFVWDAGFILAEHVLRDTEWQTSSFSSSVLELGAGTGITGLMVAKAFPQTTNVHLTDLPVLQPLLHRNAKDIPNATVGVLEWGQTTTSNNNHKYDIILGADVVASIYCADALAKTIQDLSGPDTKVYLACRDRLAGSIEQFEMYMRQIFSHVERKKAQSANKNPDVWILYATGKRLEQ